MARMGAIVEFGAPDAATASVETRFTDPAAPTVLAFAGMAHGLQMPIAEFVRVLAPLNVNVVFVKDLRQCWYQHGVPGLGDSPAEAAEALAALVPAGSSLSGTVGTSSGGTGAIIFGALLGVPTALAFSPRTLIDDAAVARWRVDIPHLPDVDTDAPTADLRRLLALRRPGRVVLRYGAGNAHDAAQAARIADLPGVESAALPTDWHPSAAWLRDQGQLGRTVAEVLGLRLLPGRDFADTPMPTARPARWSPRRAWRARRRRG